MYIVIYYDETWKKNKDVFIFLFVKNLLSTLVAGQIYFFEVGHPKEEQS